VISGYHGPQATRQRRDQLVDGSGALVVGTHHGQCLHLDTADRLDWRGDDRIQHTQQRDRVSPDVLRC